MTVCQKAAFALTGHRPFSQTEKYGVICVSRRFRIHKMEKGAGMGHKKNITVFSRKTKKEQPIHILELFSYFRSPRSIDITVSCSFVLRLFHIYLTLKMMQHLVALLSIIYCKKTSVLSFLVRWCWDHDQHTRLCPVLRFWNPNQITSGILDSPNHFSHNNLHTPSVPLFLDG